MKPILTLFLFLFAAGLLAQPTMMASWAPSVGDQVQSVVAADANVLEPGPSGANVSWDYSAVMQNPDVPVVRFTYADPSVSSFSNSFPDANLVLVIAEGDPNDSPATFYQKTDNEFVLLGNALSGFSNVYSDPQIFMQFPFSFGSSFEDDFASTSDINGIMSFVTGTVTVSADAYGTIQTPQGTFPNAIRIKTETTRTDSTAIAPGSYSLVNQNMVNYLWFSGTIGDNIASLTITNGESITVTAGQTFTDTQPENRAFSWSDLAATSSLEDPDLGQPVRLLSYGPNPVTDRFQVMLDATCSCPVRLELSNHLGQLVRVETHRLVSGRNQLTVPVGDIPAGQYWVRLRYDDGYRVFPVQKLR